MKSKCDAAFKKQILSKCYDALESIGFTRFNKNGVDWPLGEGFNCWVGLNSALHSDRVELVPNIGLHVEPVERMIFETDQSGNFPKYNRKVATYAFNIGTIDSISDEPAFAFSPNQSNSFLESECERLAYLYTNNGLEYVRTLASYDALAPLLKEYVNSLGGNPERYAVCLYLLGLKHESMNFLENFPEQYKSYIQGFAVPFIAKIQSELGTL